MSDVDRYRAEYVQTGEAIVRDMLERGVLSEFKAGVARAWLGEIDRARTAAAASEEEADRKHALRLAGQANTIATFALIVSVMAMTIGILAIFVAR